MTLELINVSRFFGGGRTKIAAVDGVNLSLSNNGSALGIVGESGSGKSTVSRMLVGLTPPSAGEILFNGRSLMEVIATRAGVRDFRRQVQFVGQDTTSSFDPLRTLRDSVRTPAQELLGLDRAAADLRVDEIVAQVGLPEGYTDRMPSQVSGGQRQRFAIARAMIVAPQLLVCDEVVSALDVSIQGVVLNLLKRFCRQGDAAVVFVSHGLPATAFISDEIAVMDRGAIVERATTSNIIHAPKHGRTVELLKAYRSVE